MSKFHPPLGGDEPAHRRVSYGRSGPVTIYYIWGGFVVVVVVVCDWVSGGGVVVVVVV
jgi:hypothetical protein